MTALLRWLVGPELAVAIAGDLEEERRRRAGRSRAGASLWFMTASLAIAWSAATTRLRESIGGMAAKGRGLGRAPAELKLVARSLRRAPWYSLTVTGLLALTMTLAVTVFAIVDGALFTPLRYPAADRLWIIQPGFNGMAPPPGGTESVSRRDIDAWMAAGASARFTGYSAGNTTELGDGVNDPLVGMASVAPDFFDVLGVRPLIGGFEPADFETRGTFQPILVSYAIWQGRFQGDPNILGRRIVRDPVRVAGYRIAGVMPREFVFPSDRVDVEVIAPYVYDAKTAADPSRRVFGTALARLQPGATRPGLDAQVGIGMAEVTRTFPALGPRPPRVPDGYWRRQGPFDRVELRPLADDLGRRSRPLFQAVFWASVVLVLLAAINVSALMAARVLDRMPEFSMRRALGATRARLARLIFVEALVLAVMASALALLAARPLLVTILTVLPEHVALLKTPSLDGRVMVFAAALAIALAIVTTLWPVARGARAGQTAPSAAAGRASDRVRSLGRFLVVSSQVAGALVLTVGGALVVGSILRVYAATPVVHVDQVSAIDTFAYNPIARINQVSPARTALVDAALDRLRRVPGVVAVGADSAQILVGGGDPSVFNAPPGAPDPKLWAYVHGVTADFYRGLELPIVAGRLPTSEEMAADARVLVVGESVARAFWPAGQAIGQMLSNASDQSVYTVIGIASDVRWNAWDEESAAIYGPFARLSRYPWTTLFVRTQGDATQVMAQAIAAIGQGDPQLRVRRVTTLGALFADSVRPRRFRAWLFGSFAAAALIVIAIGVCGLLAMTTARRTREVGIRMALGATRPSVFGLLLREQLPAVLAGLAVGGLAAAWAVTFVKSYLYQLTMYDARVWAVAVGLILGVAALGALVPAVRASRVDPVQALRAE